MVQSQKVELHQVAEIPKSKHPIRNALVKNGFSDKITRATI